MFDPDNRDLSQGGVLLMVMGRDTVLTVKESATHLKIPMPIRRCGSDPYVASEQGMVEYE